VNGGARVPGRASIALLAVIAGGCAHDWDRFEPHDAPLDVPARDDVPSLDVPDLDAADCGAGSVPRPRCDEASVAVCTSRFDAEPCCPDLDGEGGFDPWICFGGDRIAGVARAPTPPDPLDGDDGEWAGAHEIRLERTVVGVVDPGDSVPRARTLWDASGLYLDLDQPSDTAIDPHPRSGATWFYGDAFEIFVRPLFSRPLLEATVGPLDGQIFVIRSAEAMPYVTRGPWTASAVTLGPSHRGWPARVTMPWPASLPPPEAGNVLGFDLAYDDADTFAIDGGVPDGGVPTSVLPVRDAQTFWHATSGLAYADGTLWGAVVLLPAGGRLACGAGWRACPGDAGVCVADRAGVLCP
jgi:hypothetical protein